MKDGLTQVKELKDKIHEQYIEIQELNKARKTDIEYNKYLQKEIIRLNTIINELEGEISRHIALCTDITLNDILDKLQELKGENNE